MLAVAFALLAAASNALSSVLQRRAALSVPADETFRLVLIRDLLRQRSWLGGIAALIVGFLFQAAALTVGRLALIQPLLVTELPFTMLLLAWLLPIRPDPRVWLSVGTATLGLVILLISANPTEGQRLPGRIDWVIATVVTTALAACLVAVARLMRGTRRAAILGGTGGLGFAFTAALMKEATHALSGGLVDALTCWAVYAMVGAGLASLFLLQNALHSGPLVAVQPALNVSDPVTSIAYGVGLFGEQIRIGGWVLVEIAGIGLILYSSARLAAACPLGTPADVRRAVATESDSC